MTCAILPPQGDAKVKRFIVKAHKIIDENRNMLKADEQMILHYWVGVHIGFNLG
jgi:hypothetical protein